MISSELSWVFPSQPCKISWEWKFLESGDFLPMFLARFLVPGVVLGPSWHDLRPLPLRARFSASGALLGALWAPFSASGRRVRFSAPGAVLGPSWHDLRPIAPRARFSAPGAFLGALRARFSAPGAGLDFRSLGLCWPVGFAWGVLGRKL